MWIEQGSRSELIFFNCILRRSLKVPVGWKATLELERKLENEIGTVAKSLGDKIAGMCL